MVDLGSLNLEIRKGVFNLKSESYLEEGVPFIRISNIQEEKMDWEDAVFISEIENQKEKRTQLFPGDLVFSKIGTIDRVGYLDNTYPVYNMSQNVIGIKFNDSSKQVLHSKFLKIIFSLNFGKEQLLREATFQVQPKLTLDNIRNIKIPLPPLDVQLQVIHAFDKSVLSKSIKETNALDLIKSVDENIAQKIGFEFPKVDVKNVFSVKVSAFESRLDPHFYLPNFKALLDNIRKTKNAQLGELIEFSKETWNQKDSFENEFPYIEISEIDLSSGKINNVSMVLISEAPSRAKMVVRTNDIIVSTTRPYRGAISLIDAEKDGNIASTGFAILRNLKTDSISKEYLFYILRTQICLQQMLQRSSGGSYPAITAEELRNIYIPIPDKAIQQEVVNDIKAFIEKAEQLKADAKTDFENAKQEIEALILY